MPGVRHLPSDETMKNKVKCSFAMKQLLTDRRFALSAACLFVWWLVLPSAPGCYLIYLATPWGQASLLFPAALALWVKPPVLYPVAVVLSAYVFSLAGESLGYDWEEIAFLPGLPFLNWGEQEGWGMALIRYMWREVLVCVLAVTLAGYAGSRFLRWAMRGGARAA